MKTEMLTNAVREITWCCRDSATQQGLRTAPRSFCRFPLWLRVLVGAAVGILLGLGFGQEPIIGSLRNRELGQLGMLVIRLLKTLAVPLVLFAILDAMLRTRISLRHGVRLVIICVVNVSVAFFIGLTLMNILRPGDAWRGKLENMLGTVGASSISAERGSVGINPSKPTVSLIRNLEGYVPRNVIDPLQQNNLITIVLIAVIGGAALRRVRNSQGASRESGGKLLADVIETIYGSLLQVIIWVIQVVPFAVLAITAERVGSVGLGVFSPLWILLGVILLGLGIHSLVYYPAAAWLIGGIGPRAFLGRGADAILTAVSGNSSLAAVPVTLSCLTEKIGISQESARLSACIGTNLNNDGITLYEAMAALFLAQACGFDLTLSQQAVVVLVSLMAGIGVAGVPEAGLIVLPLVLEATGLPDSIVAVALPLLLPVDWILARARSGVNVMSDMLVAILLDRWGLRSSANPSQ